MSGPYNPRPTTASPQMTALANAGFDADLRIYPPGRHGAAYNGQSAMLIQQATDAYLNRWMH